MYRLIISSTFQSSYLKISKNNDLLKKRIKKSISLLMHDPKHPSLNSHKVDTVDFKDVWSSWVTGDVRIIWEFANNEIRVIHLLTIGTHSGKHKVYS